MRNSYAHITSTLALVVALSGTAYAATQVTSANIKNNTIKSADIKNGGIKGKDVSSAAQAEIRGPAGQIVTTRPVPATLQGTKAVLKLELAAGAWAVVAHVGAVHNGVNDAARLECTLSGPSGVLDFGKLRLDPNVDPAPQIFGDLSFNGAVTLASPGSVTVTCSNVTADAAATMTLTGLAMTATRGQSVTVQ